MPATKRVLRLVGGHADGVYQGFRGRELSLVTRSIAATWRAYSSRLIISAAPSAMATASALSCPSLTAESRPAKKPARRVGGDGTKKETLYFVRVRRLPKQMTMTLKDLEQEIRKYVDNRGLHFQLGFNGSELGDYDSCTWLDEADKEKALSEESVWTIEIFGRVLGESLYLAASSLPTLVQMLAQYELRPESQR